MQVEVEYELYAIIVVEEESTIKDCSVGSVDLVDSGTSNLVSTQNRHVRALREYQWGVSRRASNAQVSTIIKDKSNKKVMNNESNSK